MANPKTVKIKKNCHSEPAATGRETPPFRFEQQVLKKKWYLIAAYGLIWMAISAIFAGLHSMNLSAETIAQNIFTIRLEIVTGALLSAILLLMLLHLYFHKLKLLEERDQLIAEIREDLAQIRTLRGLLRVCSYCKKVRNNKGYWEQIERYVANNSHAEFTHGICPECAASLVKRNQMDILFLKGAGACEKSLCRLNEAGLSHGE